MELAIKTLGAYNKNQFKEIILKMISIDSHKYQYTKQKHINFHDVNMLKTQIT